VSALLPVSFVAPFVSLYDFGLPPDYFASIRSIDNFEYTIEPVGYATAIIATSLALKLFVCALFTFRFAGNLGGAIIVFPALWLAGLIIGDIVRDVGLRGWLHHFTPSLRELLRYLFDWAFYSLLAMGIITLDLLSYAVTRLRFRQSRKRFVLTIFILGMIIPIVGLSLLSWWAEFLLVIYLWLAFPVLMAMVSMIQTGEPITWRVALEMHREMLRTIVAAIKSITGAVVAIARTILS
jgi:hypothetical protein